MDEVVKRLADEVGELLRWASFPREDAVLAEMAAAVSTQLSRLEAARALLAAQLDAAGFAKSEGATSTAVWLRQRCGMSVGGAHRTMLLGRHLGATSRSTSDPDRLLAAVTAGQVSTDQALAIGAALTDLPRGLGIDVHDQAETMLIGFAATLTAAELAKAGERILDLVAPEVAEQAEARRLAKLDEQAHRLREFHISVDHTGCSRLRGRLDAEATARVRAAIDSLSRPLPAADGTRDPRSAAQRNADALHELCRLALDFDRLPDHGGSRPQLIITTSYDTLTQQLGGGDGSDGAGAATTAVTATGGLGIGTLGIGTLESGVRLAPETVRRLACDALIIPAVLGSAGELLDLGRTQRLITTPLRNALIARDGGCTFPGCDRPARWCQGHHVIPWASGGETSLENSTLLCGWHHRLIHQGDWKISRRNDGHFAYVPPPHLDPQQRPRTNNRFLRR